MWHVRDRIAPDYLPRAGGRRAATADLRAAERRDRQLRSDAGDAAGAGEEARSCVRSTVHDPVTAPRTSACAPRRQSLVVGMVGRLAPWKGQHVFLEAFARAFGEGDARAIVVGSAMFGSAETRYAAALHELATSLGIADRVEFRGFRDDVWAELADMDMLVHASITPEPFGQVIVEAMHAGLPVIAASGGGPSEIVTDGVDGLLYPPGDVDGLCAALTRLAARCGASRSD